MCEAKAYNEKTHFPSECQTQGLPSMHNGRRPSPPPELAWPHTHTVSSHSLSQSLQRLCTRVTETEAPGVQTLGTNLVIRTCDLGVPIKLLCFRHQGPQCGGPQPRTCQEVSRHPQRQENFVFLPCLRVLGCFSQSLYPQGVCLRLCVCMHLKKKILAIYLYEDDSADRKPWQWKRVKG